MPKALALIATTALPVIAAFSAIIPVGTLQTCVMTNGKPILCTTTSATKVYKTINGVTSLRCATPGYPTARSCSVITAVVETPILN